MARRRRAEIRDIIPDAKYGDVLIARFINYVMINGKRSVVEKAIYSALDDLAKKVKGDALELFKEAIEIVKPRIEVRSRRIGGATYQIPVEVPERRAIALSLKWLTMAIKKQSGRGLGDKVYKVFQDTLNKSGWAFKKKEEVFRMAEANKAFSHYSW
ncbi:30S ribosomal protein S7 [Pseudomonadota bacterium]